MKNTIFAALLAVLFVCFSCSKADKSEPAPATPPTTEVNNEGTSDSGLEGNDEISLRATSCINCNTCCCRVTVKAPTNAVVDVGFCSSIFPSCGSPGCGCALGDGTCGSGAASGSNEEIALDLQQGVTNEDWKEWCSGDSTVVFVIHNREPILSVTYEIDCSGPGTPLPTVTLAPGEKALVRKFGNCNPIVACTYF